MAKMLDDRMLRAMDAYWRAANYLTVGQIYLRDNPLLRDHLRPEHIKPRLLGHWGTSPGQNFIYVHINRLICQHDADVIFIRTRPRRPLSDLAHLARRILLGSVSRHDAGQRTGC